MALIAIFRFDLAMIRIYPDNGGDKMLYGAKVLGSYVGSEESIANRLEKKLAELKKEADAITMVGSLQIQYIGVEFNALMVLVQKEHSSAANDPA